MPKHIVICADGTGNTSIKGRGTNVFKLYEAVDQNGHRADPALTPQAAVYHDGVGTESNKWWRAFTGATGFGLARNVRQLYTSIARLYSPGDRIYLFGFSRGAFTVRTLAGLIDTCGIVDITRCPTELAVRKTVRLAYREYRRKYQTTLSQQLLGKREPRDAAFRTTHSIRDLKLAPDGRIPIEFIGVWDTVDAVGMPFHIADVWNTFVHRFKFTDRTLNERVKRACHALAIDEQRESFTPVLWREADGDDRVEQVWFAGVHSNVGGGYPKQGVSLVALDWMMARAEQSALRFVPSERAFYRQCHSVDDELYDSRAGVGVFYRWKPRAIDRLCHDHNVEPKIHASAFERAARATAGYAPGNIPAGSRAVYTAHAFPGLASIPSVMRQLTGGGKPLTAGVRHWITAALVSYYVFLLTVLFIAGQVVRQAWVGIEQNFRAENWVELVPSKVSLLTLAIDVVRVHWAVIISGLALAYGGSWLANRKMELYFSGAWHRVQPKLRKVLGL